MSQSKQEYSIAVAPDGRLMFIYDDHLAGLCEEGEVRTKRVSYVEPAYDRWGQTWTADLSPVNGPVLGPYKLREEALDAETNWLRENLF